MRLRYAGFGGERSTAAVRRSTGRDGREARSGFFSTRIRVSGLLPVVIVDRGLGAEQWRTPGSPRWPVATGRFGARLVGGGPVAIRLDSAGC